MEDVYDKEVEETVLLHAPGLCQELNPWIHFVPS